MGVAPGIGSSPQGISGGSCSGSADQVGLESTGGGQTHKGEFAHLLTSLRCSVLATPALIF